MSMIITETIIRNTPFGPGYSLSAERQGSAVSVVDAAGRAVVTLPQMSSTAKITLAHISTSARMDLRLNAEQMMALARTLTNIAEYIEREVTLPVPEPEPGATASTEDTERRALVTLSVPVEEDDRHPSAWDWTDLVGTGTRVVAVEPQEDED